MCRTPDIVQSIEAVEKSGEPGNLWMALTEKFQSLQSQRKHTVGEVHQQLIYIKITSAKNFITCQRISQPLTNILDSKSYSVPHSRTLEIPINGLREVYRSIVQMINLSFFEDLYH